MDRSEREAHPEDELLDGLTELSDDDLRERALKALRQRRFDLADRLLARGDLGLEAMIENLRVYQAELEIQNEELVRSQHHVEEGLARFTSLFNTLPIAELVVDRQGLVKEANLAAQSLFRLQGSHFRQHFFARLIDEPDRSRVIAAWGELSEDRALVLDEVHFRVRDDGDFLADLHIAPFQAGGDEPLQFVCAVIDRTEAVRQRRSLLETGERLRRSEATLKERLKELATLHGILLCTSQPQTSLREVLEQVVERLPGGFSRSDLAEARIRLPEVSAATPGFVETRLSLSVPILLAGTRVGDAMLVYRIPPPDEDEPVFLDEERRLLESVATHLSVYLTRIHDEARLKESRERYRVLAEFSSDWEYWLGPDGRYLYVSPACESISGYTAEAFVSDANLFGRLILPADQAIWDAHLDALADDPAGLLESLELRLSTRDGRERWIEHVCNPVLSEEGRFLGRRGVNRDITERKRFEEELKRSGDFLNATGRLAKVGGWEYDPAARTVRFTEGTLAGLGVSVEGTPTLDALLALFDTRDREQLRESIEQAIVFGTPFDMDARLTAGRTEPSWVQMTCEPFVDADGVIKLLGAVQDITARVEAEKSLRQAARVFESTAEAVVITDEAHRILAVNRAFTEITGYGEAEVLGKTPSVMRSGRHQEDFYHAMSDALAQTGQWRGEIWNARKDGHVYPALLTVSAVLDSAGQATHFVGVFSDISQLKQSEARLEYLAHHDPLTGLPNRSLFQERLEKCLQRAKRYKRQFALLFLDLDRFKEVNDTLGHGVGDGLLLAVAEVLAGQVREVDTIARLGGDEFVIILEDIPASRFAATFADRLMEIFARPFSVLDRDLYVTASIGISIYPDDGTDMETLVRHADVAMYQAKNSGRNGFSFFESAMSEGAMERLRLEHDLRLAIKREELILHYQPQLQLSSKSLCGVEVLCRWAHPELGQIGPAVFIPLAEEIGLIDELGFWVLEQACRQVVAWDRAGFRVPRLAVNLSVRGIERDGLVNRVAAILSGTGLEPARLELEVDESKIMGKAEAAIPPLLALRELGVTLAIDDFGTGYSSLTHLKHLPLNRLKIDGSFTCKLTEDPDDDTIVRAIIALAHNMGLDVIAEGVESRDQADLLLSEGCEEGQGYLFGRAVGSEAFVELWG